MEELSEEDYIKVSNKFTMLLTELGVSHLDDREKILLDLFDLCADEDRTEESVKKEISDLSYQSQLNAFMNGIEKCTEMVIAEFKKKNWIHDFLNLDNALKYLFEYAKDSDVLFNSAEELADIAKGYFSYMREEDIKHHAPEFIEEIGSTLLQFLDNSYLLGLTDTRSLYHALSKYYNADVPTEDIAQTLDNLFPEIS